MKKIELPIEEINHLYLGGLSTLQLANKYGCSKQTINRCLKVDKRTNTKNISGEKFFKLEVLERLDTQKNGSYENLCRCECGTEIKVSTHDLLCHRVKCCGSKECIERNNTNPRPCMVGNRNPRWKGYGAIPGKFWSTLEKEAKSRNKVFTISIEDLQELWNKQEGRCAISGLKLELGQQPYRTASIDRRDNKQGYTKDNIQWVHKTINMMKSKYNQDEFIKFCKIIAKHNK